VGAHRRSFVWGWLVAALALTLSGVAAHRQTVVVAPRVPTTLVTPRVPTTLVTPSLAPTITGVEPDAVKCGGTCELRLFGRNLESVTSITIRPSDGVRVLSRPIPVSLSELRLRIAVDADATAGRRSITVGAPELRSRISTVGFGVECAGPRPGASRGSS